MTSLFRDANGVRLHVKDYGGDGPPLILLHSTGFGQWMWAPHARELSRRFHVYAPDQRGHGDSDKVEGFGFDTLARDMAALLDALDRRAVYAAGHSSGATTLATLDTLFPGRIKRLLMVEPVMPHGRRGPPVPSDAFHGPNEMVERTRRRRAVFASAEDMFQHFRGRPPFATWTEESLRLYCEQGTFPAEGGVALKCPPALEARFYEAVGEFDAAQALASATVPMRFLLAASGRDGGPSSGAQHLVPQAEHKVIPGTTHFIPMEKPEVVVAEALDFFGKDAV